MEPCPPSPETQSPGPVRSVPRLSAGSPLSPAAVTRRVMVVDDSPVQRRILRGMLEREGRLEVVQACSTEEAMQLAAEQPPDLVLSDWLMGGRSGIDLCQSLRAGRQGGEQPYIYFILMSARSEKPDMAAALRAGADDFLSKPVNGAELRARIGAGLRLLDMQDELRAHNRLIAATLSELHDLYQSLDRDLVEARRLQQSLVRESYRDFGSAEVSVLLRPAGRIGGDLAGFFPINSRRLGLFSMDVSGHGVTSALIIARLAGYFSASLPHANIALTETECGLYDGHPPDEVALSLNRLLLEEIETESYLTLLYADVDLVTGEAALVQAGHPHPVLLRPGQPVQFPGQGGLPVGLLPEAQYETVRLQLQPGDRLLILSDGVTEARDSEGRDLGEAGLAQWLEGHRHLPGRALLTRLEAWLEDRNPEIADDISGLLLDFHSGKF